MYLSVLRSLLLFLAIFCPLCLFAAPDTFYVSGKQIYDPCGNVFVPRGINYPVLDDWGFPANMSTSEQSSEIRKASPNIVRIVWYNDYGQASRPAFALKDLDSVITRFRRYNIVSMIDVHDVTCSNDYTLYNTRVNTWWTSTAVVALMNKHRGHVMLNIANEFGYVNWAGNPSTALTAWTNNYKTTIAVMRNAGLTSPLVIDAPDCGTSLDPLLSAASALQAQDPIHNIIFSAHAYWASSFGYDSLTLRSKMLQISNASVPVILGEIANYQSDTQPCQYPINYIPLLKICQELNIGWLAWNWTNDYCSSRQMSNNGTFTSLSTYGNTVVNGAGFGLAASAVKSPYLISAGCSTPTPLPLGGRIYCYPKQIGNRIQLTVNADRLQSLTTITTYAGRNGLDWQQLDTRWAEKEANYSIPDNDNTSGKHYYQVRALLPDGTVVYSPVSTLTFRSGQDPVTVRYEETGNALIQAAIQGNIAICNTTGAITYRKSLDANEIISTDKTGLTTGFYFLRFTGNHGESYTQKISIIRGE